MDFQRRLHRRDTGTNADTDPCAHPDADTRTDPGSNADTGTDTYPGADTDTCTHTVWQPAEPRTGGLLAEL